LACIGGELIEEVDEVDIPESDQNACTIEACVMGLPVRNPANAGTVNASEKQSCNGTCQGGAAAGQCGLRLYSRPFPQSGNWENTPLSEAGWDGSGDAPPPRDIVGAEWVSANPPRLMVWVQAAQSASATYYERVEGQWRTPVPVAATGVFASLFGLKIASASGSNYNPIRAPGPLVILTTEAPSPLACAFEFNANDSLVVADPCVSLMNEVDPDINPMWAPPRGTQTPDWIAVEQREACCGGNSIWTWSGWAGTVYQQRQLPNVDGAPAPDGTSFIYVTPPVAEPNSPMQFGAVNGPLAGTAVEAFYDAQVKRMCVIAP
jgi:hypothetical protein